MPRTLRTYHEAIDGIVEKKAESQSPVLLIWSIDFWRDKHRWGADLIEYMGKAFADTPARLVVFIESLDGETGPQEGPFWANLSSTILKPFSGQRGGELDALTDVIHLCR